MRAINVSICTSSPSAGAEARAVEGGLLEHGARAMPLAPLTLAWCEEPAAQSCVFTGPDASGSHAWWLSWSGE